MEYHAGMCSFINNQYLYPFNPQNEDYIEFKYVLVIAAFAIQISFLQVEINGHFGAHSMIGGGGGGGGGILKN